MWGWIYFAFAILGLPISVWIAIPLTCLSVFISIGVAKSLDSNIYMDQVDTRTRVARGWIIFFLQVTFFLGYSFLKNAFMPQIAIGFSICAFVLAFYITLNTNSKYYGI